MLGLHVHTARPLDDALGEVRVVDQVLRAGQHLPVAARADHRVLDALRYGVLLAGLDQEHRADVRGEFAGLGVDRGRIAGASRGPSRRSTRRGRRPAGGAGHGRSAAGCAACAGAAAVRRRRRPPGGAAQGAERGVRAGRQPSRCCTPQAAARHRWPAGRCRRCSRAHAAEERPVPGGQPAPAGTPSSSTTANSWSRQRTGALGRQLALGRPRQHPLHLVQQGVLVRPRQIEPAALTAQPVPYDGPAQHRDPLGRDGHQTAPAEVREVPVGEGEFVLGEEGAAVDGAPRGQLHHPVGPGRSAGGERALRGLGQQGVPPGSSARPPTRGPLVLGVQHVGAGDLGQPGVQRRERARQRQVVAVQEQPHTCRSPPASRRCAPRSALRTAASGPGSPGSPARRTRRRRPPRSRPRSQGGPPSAGASGASQTGISWRSPKDWPRTESSAWDSRPATPWDGTMMLKRGILFFLSSCGRGRAVPPDARWTAGSGRAASSRGHGNSR